ncbi:MAG: AAA family ATPase [Leptospiraceae bacterium]|nr:AAA family ATPase [Leptospiraceae bacterium]MCP5494758.1 AAA family ATPase [Leptospiraceae bacterium]
MIKKIILENTGPIELLNYKFSQFNGENKPLILVGENGSGKSIALSFIVNSLISAKQNIFDDTEVEKGKVYKLRSPGYIKNDQHFYYSKIEFSNDIHCVEIQLDMTKKEYEEFFKHTPNHKEWSSMKNFDFSLFSVNYNSDTNKLRDFFNQNSLLYFPPNRFEEPAWLNIYNLNHTAKFADEPKFYNLSNRQIIRNTTLSKTKNWLLDVLFDRMVFERQSFSPEELNQQKPNSAKQVKILQHLIGGGIFEGRNSKIIQIINDFLKVLFQDNSNYRIGIGHKNDRKISIIKNEKKFIQDLFYLSTGEALIFSMFCSILRDYDKTGMPIDNISDIKGIVIIDEIDLHLHTKLQYNLLPKFVKQFPNIQFIITTHSPLFLLGLKKEYTEEGFDIINLPSGKIISTEYFSEFESTYNILRESEKYAKEISIAISNSKKPIVFVEGDYDIKYLQKAAEFLDKKELLDSIELKDSVGYGNIDKVWKHFDSKLSEITPQKIILLYDCDTNKNNTNKGNIYKQLIPTNEVNPIKTGIENLFSKDTIKKAIDCKSEFIDETPSYDKTIRGEIVNIKEKWEVNKDEKKNLCDWICENCSKNEFRGFEQVFTMLNEVLKK